MVRGHCRFAAGFSMQTSSQRWWWYAVYVAVMIVLGVAVHAAGKRVEYTWRWERIPQYLISNDGTELNAPFDGFVSIAADQKTLTLKELRGGDRKSTRLNSSH